MPIQLTEEQAKALGLAPATPARQKPTGADMLRVIAEALEEVEKSGLPFTHFSVTEKARALHPELEISHGDVRSVIKSALAFGKYATTLARVDGEETVLYTRLP